MPTKPITKTNVDECEPASRQWVLWDGGRKDVVKGFGLLVMPSGTRTYIFQYRAPITSKLQRHTIGRHGKLTPDQARRIAKDLAADVAKGIDPRGEAKARKEAVAREAEQEAERVRKAGEFGFRSYVDGWLRDKAHSKKPLRPGTESGYRTVLLNHAAPIVGDKALPDISKDDIKAVLKGIPASQPSVRRLTFAALRSMFNWAVVQDDIAASPVASVESPGETPSRDRVLSQDELARVLRAAATLPAPMGPFYRVLALTGQRRDEVAQLNWIELDRSAAIWLLPAVRSKNGKPHLVPLSPPVVAILDSLAGVDPKSDEKQWPKRGFLFASGRGTAISAYSRGKRALDQAMLTLARADAEKAGDDPADAKPIDPWRLHDLRRTMATGFQNLGVRFEVTEAALNHVSGSKRGVAGIYQRHDWATEKREALNKWANRCAALIDPPTKTASVVQIRTAKRSA